MVFPDRQIILGFIYTYTHVYIYGMKIRYW